MPLDGLATLQILSTDSTGQESSNTLHLSEETAGSPPSYAALQGLAEDFAVLAVPIYLPLLVTTSTMVSITARQVADPAITPPELVAEFSHGVGSAGTRSLVSPPLPRQVCALVQIKSVAASRRFRSHNFLPPVFNMNAVSGDYFAGLPDTYWIDASAWQAFLKTGLADAPTRWTGSTLSNYVIACYSRIAQLESQPSVVNASAILLSNRVRWLRSRAKGTV